MNGFTWFGITMICSKMAMAIAGCSYDEIIRTDTNQGIWFVSGYYLNAHNSGVNARELQSGSLVPNAFHFFEITHIAAALGER